MHSWAGNGRPIVTKPLDLVRVWGSIESFAVSEAVKADGFSACWTDRYEPASLPGDLRVVSLFESLSLWMPPLSEEGVAWLGKL